LGIEYTRESYPAFDEQNAKAPSDLSFQRWQEGGKRNEEVRNRKRDSARFETIEDTEATCEEREQGELDDHPANPVHLKIPLGVISKWLTAMDGCCYLRTIQLVKAAFASYTDQMQSTRLETATAIQFRGTKIL
jgi:hypothetical protein